MSFILSPRRYRTETIIMHAVKFDEKLKEIELVCSEVSETG